MTDYLKSLIPTQEEAEAATVLDFSFMSIISK